MDVPGAILVINQLSKIDREIVPITPEEASKARLPVFKVTRNGKGEPLFCHVNRVDYIEYIRRTFGLIKKGAPIAKHIHNQSTS